MAPLTDASVDDLKSTVTSLEKRIADLEKRLAGQNGGAPASAESVRMILMGPPGAGMLFPVEERVKLAVLLTWHVRQGYSGAQDQGEVLRLPSCRFLRTSG